MDNKLQTNDVAAYYQSYVKTLTERLAEAHETIGRLRYHLERNGIELPEHLAEKKRMAGEMVAIIGKINPKILLGDYSLN